MAASFKSIDIYERSDYTYGVQSPNDSRGKRGVCVTGLNTSNSLAEQYQEGAKYIADNLDATFPDDDKLPLRASAFALVNNQGEGIGAGLYGRIPGITAPDRPAHELISRRPGRASLVYYRQPNVLDSNGRPAGALRNRGYSISTGDVEVSASAYAWPVDTEAIILPTILDTDPTDSLREFIGATNTQPVKLRDMIDGDTAGESDYEFPANTLWFRGILRDSTETRTGSRKPIRYYFEFTDSPGWVQQMLLTLGDTVSGYTVTSASLSLGPSNVPYIIANYVFSTKRKDFNTMNLPVHSV